MPSSTHAAAFAALLAILVPRTAAAQLTLSIADGRVTVEAIDVPTAAILEAWARVGNTRIDGAERLEEDRVTLRLTSVPETEALRAVLRPASGYVACERQLAVKGASLFSRILVLPAAATPVAAGPHGVDGDAAAETSNALREGAASDDVSVEGSERSPDDERQRAEDGELGTDDRGQEEEDGAQALQPAPPVAVVPPAPSPRIIVPAGAAPRPGLVTAPPTPPARGTGGEDP